jgi:hypothetical protein
MVTKFDKSISKLGWYLKFFALFLFIVLLLLAVLSKFYTLSSGFIQLAILCGLGAIIVPILSFIVDIIPTLITLRNLHNDAFRCLLLEIHHDNDHVSRLKKFDKQNLELAQQWLTIKIERLKNRIGLFLGGSDKIALLALVGMGWAAVKEFPTSDTTWRHDAFLYGSAFILGLSLGGILLNILIQRYLYQKDLLALSLSQINAETKNLDQTELNI